MSPLFWITILSTNILAEDPVPCKLDNARNLNEIIPFFNSHIEEKYIGQYKAVSDVSYEIQTYLNQISITETSKQLEMDLQGPPNIKLHFVGPSGTGKSFLAQIVALSFFKQERCNRKYQELIPNALLTLGTMGMGASFLPFISNPIGLTVGAGSLLGYMAMKGTETKFCFDSVELTSWLESCGVFQTQFVLGNEAENLKSLNHVLDDLATFLDVSQDSKALRAVLVLDDFNLCEGKCQENKNLKLLVNDGYLVKEGKKIFASRIGIFFTSDLTNMGLRLERGEEYTTALDKVTTAAKSFWKKNLVVENMKLIPFSPLSDAEIIKIIEKVLDMTRFTIKNRIEAQLQQQSQVDDVEYAFTGRVIFPEDAKTAVVDHLDDIIRQKNSRAVVEGFKRELIDTLRYPKPIEERLLDKPTISCANNNLGFVEAAGWTNPKPGYCYQNDIVLHVEPYSKDFLKLSIAD
eukprot:maker-scaffold_14-snap-gene-4.49-mRNA-1 protein AED:0.00 eAED:0.00 QI:17/1/1/1/1/1/2/54/462